jgi:hypothetical protein
LCALEASSRPINAVEERTLRDTAPVLAFSVLGETVAFECADPALAAILLANCAGHPTGDGLPTLRYMVTARPGPLSFALSRDDREPLVGVGGHDFLFAVEQDLTVELQRRRPDLLFLHAAALEWQGEVHLLVGASGIGKSTTAWGLLHDDFAYLSDELAPVDLDTMRVLPYPRALCLKRDPGDFPLPADALDFGTAIYVAAHSLPAPAIDEPKPLAGIFVLGRIRSGGEPRIRVLGRAEAGARVYPHTLNALAHPGLGLDAIARVVDRVPCAALDAGAVRPTCAAIRTIVERASDRSSASRRRLSSKRGIDQVAG